MQSFHAALNYIDKIIYIPTTLIVNAVQEEIQNSAYAAGRFKLVSGGSSKTVRFRVAKQTPTKVGQFVTFWENDANNNNQPYRLDNAPDLLVITVFKNEGVFGQFVFPKHILLEKNILTSGTNQGKMAIRVYPSWDKPTNKTAIKTQLWQLGYFFEVDNINALPIPKIVALYDL